jgi:hypothetical protein
MSNDDDFVIDLDFTGVSREGGQFKILPEGKCELTIVDIQKHPNKSNPDGGPVYHVHFEHEDGAKPRAYFATGPDNLWAFRNFLEVVTGQTFDGPISFRKSEVIGQRVGAIATVVDHNDPTKLDSEGNRQKINNLSNFFAV